MGAPQVAHHHHVEGIGTDVDHHHHHHHRSGPWPRVEGARLKDPDAIYSASFAGSARGADRPAGGRLSGDRAAPDPQLRHAATSSTISSGRRCGRRRAARPSPPARRSWSIRNGRRRHHPLAPAGAKPGDLHARRGRRAEAARALGTTRRRPRSTLWRPHLGGAVVAIGNAPTALFRLLELLADGAPAPALVAGFPVGFVGAAEAKDALIAHRPELPYHHAARSPRRQQPGRRGGQRLERGGAVRVAAASDEPWLSVVGIGDDGLAALSPPRARCSRPAEILVGGARHQAMVPKPPPSGSPGARRSRRRSRMSRPGAVARWWSWPAAIRCGLAVGELLARRFPLGTSCASCRRPGDQPGLRAARLVAGRGRDAQPACAGPGAP